MIAAQNRTWAAAADHFARSIDEPLLTLMGAAHSLASDPDSPDARRLAESAARNAQMLASMVRDLQRIASRAATPARREMIEVLPALRAALAGNVRIDGDESLVALAAPGDLAAFVDAIVASADGKTVTVCARLHGDVVRIGIRVAFPDRPLDIGLIRTLAAPLGPVAVGVDGSVSLALPALSAPSPASRWQPDAGLSGLGSR